MKYNSSLSRNCIFFLTLGMALGVKSAQAGNENLYFFAYHNCAIVDEDKDSSDIINEIESKQGPLDFSKVDEYKILPQIAHKELRPRVNDSVYLFAHSNLIGREKVKKVYLCENGVGEQLLFDVDQKEIPEEFKDPEELENSLEVLSNGPVDVEKLKVLNSHNRKLLKNKLADEEIESLKAKISKILKNKTAGEVGTGLKPRKSFKEAMPKPIQTGGQDQSWTPDLAPGWEKDALISGSLKLDDLKTRIVLFNVQASGTDTLFFIACQNQKGISFYSVGGEGDCRFDQIINWFGDYYLSFWESESGGNSMTIYEITDNGLKQTGSLNGTIGGEDMD